MNVNVSDLSCRANRAWRAAYVLAKLIARWGQPSLRQVAGRVLRDHLRRNQAAQDLRYGRIRYPLAVLRRRPREALCLVALVYGLVTLAGAAIPPPSWMPVVRANVTDAYRDLVTVDLTLLGAQATLLGLVYPLVIALIGLLFEARSTPGARLQTYFQETEAVAVGGMALAFVLSVALQTVFLAVLDQNVLALITVINTCWFTANVGALGFFVVRSLQFLQPAQRQRLVRS